MALAAGNHEINKSFEAGPLARLVRGPAVVVERLTVLSGVAVAEQIFEPVLADERVTLDVEEHVAGRGWRRAQRPTSGSMGNSSKHGCPESRASTCSRACSRTRSKAAEDPRPGFHRIGIGSCESARVVVTPFSTSSA